MSDSKQRRRRPIVSDKIDKGSTAYHIIVTHLGGPSETAELSGVSVHTVYGWLQRGIVPARQQDNLSTKAEEAGKPFPFEWYRKAPEPESVAEAA